MSKATLKVRDRGNGEKEIVVDCDHATTTGYGLVSERAGVGESMLVAAIVSKHHNEEGCHCTQELRRRYPSSLLPKTLWIKD